MSETVAWQFRTKETGWGPPGTSKKIADQLIREGYQCRELQVKEPFDEAKERKRFESFMSITLCYTPFELEFEEARNCYKEYRIHLAWQCWREALQ